ncbi:hypothetical protein PF002_g18022 [Phytophthora fragariae]|uniref:Uncharacterized protein n=1 Tax=Phytophthora fragariae TaxID=53985 RepID=A0A6A3EGM9_9STRA|nr:hypothetical protein PF003_g10611 [Phytophthora fragariae]KAE8931653.1 hypothetical protein PF009_g18293 [Phytophthora fragariae]KAE8995690.1 hypothetical protein PF011_g16214 [Phytophthora fragariae]KAE9095924.1 hypothetical protein PF007_g17204 [Phytophthora fragariae]KAE9107214.1 hypothetical protein PF006_g21172 [Phytophthora fragariae]
MRCPMCRSWVRHLIEAVGWPVGGPTLAVLCNVGQGQAEFFRPFVSHIVTARRCTLLATVARPAKLGFETSRQRPPTAACCTMRIHQLDVTGIKAGVLGRVYNRGQRRRP